MRGRTWAAGAVENGDGCREADGQGGAAATAGTAEAKAPRKAVLAGGAWSHGWLR